MSNLDWVIYTTPLVLISIVYVIGEVSIYRRGGDAWKWSGVVSRHLPKWVK